MMKAYIVCIFLGKHVVWVANPSDCFSSPTSFWKFDGVGVLARQPGLILRAHTSQAPQNKQDSQLPEWSVDSATSHQTGLPSHVHLQLIFFITQAFNRNSETKIGPSEAQICHNSQTWCTQMLVQWHRNLTLWLLHTHEIHLVMSRWATLQCLVKFSQKSSMTMKLQAQDSSLFYKL